jgi:hypothetical protein
MDVLELKERILAKAFGNERLLIDDLLRRATGFLVNLRRIAKTWIGHPIFNPDETETKRSGGKRELIIRESG